MAKKGDSLVEAAAVANGNAPLIDKREPDTASTAFVVFKLLIVLL